MDEETRKQFTSRSLPGEHITPNSLPASLPTTTNINLVPAQQVSNTTNTNTTSNISSPSSSSSVNNNNNNNNTAEDNFAKLRRTRRSLSTSYSSQSLLKRSLSIKPRASVSNPSANNSNNNNNSPTYPPTPTTATESDASNRSSFEDFDYSSPNTPITGTNSGSTSSNSSLNSPLLSTSDTSTTAFPFYTRERHHSLFVLSGKSSNIISSQGNQIFPPLTTTSAPATSTMSHSYFPQQNSASSSTAQAQFSSSLTQSPVPSQYLLQQPCSVSGNDASTTSSFGQQKFPLQPIQRRPSGASSQLKRLLSIKSENYPASLYSDSETDSIETDSDAYFTNDEQSFVFPSSSMKRRPSFQRSPTHRFFPDLSIDAEENHLSNLHIIDEGSPEFTFPKVKRKLIKELEEAKCRADKRIMIILENWYQSHQYQELLSELLYDGWSDDDDKQSSPIAIRRNNSQRTLSKSVGGNKNNDNNEGSGGDGIRNNNDNNNNSTLISDTDDEATLPPNNKKSLAKSSTAAAKNKQFTHKIESMSLHGDSNPKNIVFLQKKCSERRLIHSNSWPPSILGRCFCYLERKYREEKIFLFYLIFFLIYSLF
jgi:hypothetical protein